MRITATKSTPVVVERQSVLRITGQCNGFERLPMYLLEEPKRVKVVKALERALRVAESGGVFAG